MKRVALGVLALATAFALETPAGATSITGSFAIAGIDTYNSTSITFNNPALVLGATGTLAVMLTSPMSVTMDNIASFNTEAGHTLFDWNFNGKDVSLQVLTLDVVLNTPEFLNVMGTGIMTETGDSPTPYLFRLTSTTTGFTSFAFDATPPSAVPEPGSLLLIGSGLVGLAGLLFRRAKKPAASSLRC